MQTLIQQLPWRQLLIGLMVFGILVMPLVPSFVHAQSTPSEETGEIIDAGDEDAVLIPSSLEGLVYNISVSIGGFFLWLGGGLLDYSVKYLVVEMGTYLTTGVGAAVDKMWVLVRDLFNVLFIFGLIYIGFRVILFSEDSSVKKTVGWLIVAALLINFSLFITKAIVDFSNVTAYQLYNAIASEQQTESGGGSTVEIYRISQAGGGSETTGVGYGITASYMDLFNLTTYASTLAAQEYEGESTLLGGRLMFYGILMMFVMLIAAFVFAAGAFLLIARFVGLILFMILSPAMFLGLIFPMFKKYQDMWWEKFLQYAFVAPAYLFMLYLSLFVLAGLGIENGSFAEGFKATSFATGAFTIFMNFFVIAGFLIAALVFAKQMGIYGATASLGMLQGAGKFLRNEAQGIAGRNTIGRPANWIDKKLKERGWSDRSTARRLATLGATNKWGSMDSRRDLREAKDAGARTAARRARTLNISTALDRYLVNSDDPAAKIAMEQAVGGGSTEQLTEILKHEKPGSARFNTLISTLRPDQFDSVVKAKDEDIDDEKKQSIKDARGDAVASQIRTTGRSNSSTIGPLTQEQALASGIPKAEMSQLKIIGAEKIIEHAGKLKASQVEDIKKSTDFTVTEKERIVEAHERQLWHRFDEDPESVFSDRKDSDVAKLPKKILTDPRAIEHMTTGMLSEIRSTLEQSDRNTIKSNIPDDRADLREWLERNTRGVEF